MMSEAITVLTRAQQEIIGEIVRCGAAGGTGRVANYAPTLISLTQAIEILEGMKHTPEGSWADKMKAAKAAKKQLQANE